MGALDSLVGVAGSIITGLGVDATLVRQAQTYNASTGAETEMRSTYAIKMSPPAGVQLKDIDGTTVVATDLQVLVKAEGLAVVPSPQTDMVEFNSIAYKVVHSVPIYVSTLVAAYKLFVRA